MVDLLWSIFTERKEKKHTNTHKRWWIYCGLFSLKEKENTHKRWWIYCGLFSQKEKENTHKHT